MTRPDFAKFESGALWLSLNRDGVWVFHLPGTLRLLQAEWAGMRWPAELATQVKTALEQYEAYHKAETFA
jgi:hypothetical protein